MMRPMRTLATILALGAFYAGCTPVKYAASASRPVCDFDGDGIPDYVFWEESPNMWTAEDGSKMKGYILLMRSGSLDGSRQSEQIITRNTILPLATEIYDYGRGYERDGSLDIVLTEEYFDRSPLRPFDPPDGKLHRIHRVFFNKGKGRFSEQMYYAP
jgi:hypothetical protein